MNPDEAFLRKEFYMDGLNCDPMSFDKECELTNAHFHKNKKHEKGTFPFEPIHFIN